MKNILILVMSCNDPFFLKQEEYIRKTWAKDIIDSKYENIDFLIYRGSPEKHSIDFNTNLFNVKCEDDLPNTFKKTYYAFAIINSKLEKKYDYILRVNTSTFVNVPLLNAFVQSLDDDKILWCSELYSLTEGFCPYPLYLYGRGNGLLISNYLVNLIIKEGINFIYLKMTDDLVIGNILNSYWIKHGEDYLSHIKSYRHGWYKCINTKANSHNSICNYHNDSKDFDFMKTFLTIQIKRYHEREKENKNYLELYNKVFKDNTDTDIDNTVSLQYEYSKNPNVFIGSILGYIPLNKWVLVDKKKLYDVERKHKAYDDQEKYNIDKVLL